VNLPLLLSLIVAIFPDANWRRSTPEAEGLDTAQLQKARDYALSGGGSGYVVRHGKLVFSWGDLKIPYDLKSSSKAIGVTALGLALKDGKVQLDDLAQKYHPEFGVPPESNRATGWLEKITLRQLANQTAGFEKPGGFTNLLFAPGTKWYYSDGGPNWLAECLTLAYQRDLNDLMFERVFTPLGITTNDLRWRVNSFRPREIHGLKRREFGSGFTANVNAMARIGFLYLQKGKWNETQIIPADFVELCAHPCKENIGLPELNDSQGNASDHYSMLWWNNGDGTIPDVPRDAFWAWGLYDSLIVVIPSLDMVVARAGQSWVRYAGEHYDPLKPFLSAICASAKPPTKPATQISSPYPPSPVIKKIIWAPTNEIVRLAKGSDNWPVTWLADNSLLAAYGDGNGFEPFLPRKQSLGLARIFGTPPQIQGINLELKPEIIGDGPSAPKASGLLAIDGNIYLLKRNTAISQLAVSTDNGRTWTDAPWKFETSFGCPTFLNFGRDYSGARDDFVYIYSADSPGAYQPADQMILARVPKTKILDRAAYEFFQSAQNHPPQWTKKIEEHGEVFTFRDQCYRSGITYNAALKRYLWCQILPGSKHPQGPRFQGGFGIYDAPEPWGPWTTVYFTTDWDTGPGESSSFPTKWISPDGKTLHLLFSGNDSFSVRKATLQLE
jgi:CubicO group peptidase (beta-lactamase class C family)